MMALTFKSFVRPTGASVRDRGEFVSRTAVNGAKFSAVCARCTSGRRCTTSGTATEVGSGGRGEVGGGTGGGLRSARRGRIVLPALPLRERPPATRFGTDPWPPSSAGGRSAGPTSVLPLRPRALEPMSELRCRAMPAFRCGLLTALSPLFATLKLLRRRRRRGATPSMEEVTLALLEARLRGMK